MSVQNALAPLLILSNISFIPPSVYCVEYGFYLPGLILFMTALTSYFYHLCRDMDMCVAPLDILQFCDHLFAINCVNIIALCFVSLLHVLNNQLTSIMIMMAFFVNAIFISVRAQRDVVELAQQLFTGFYCLTIIFVAIFTAVKSSSLSGVNLEDVESSARYGQVRKRFSRVKWGVFAAGIVLCLVGYLCFSLMDMWNPGNYTIWHSLWHVAVGMGLTVILTSMNYSHEEIYHSKRNRIQYMYSAAISLAKSMGINNPELIWLIKPRKTRSDMTPVSNSL